MKEKAKRTRYYVVRLYAEAILDVEQKKKFLNSVFSQINKFNDAIGYKTEKENCPARILWDKFRTPYEGNVVAEFYIPIQRVRTLPNKKRVCGTILVEKWMKFLRKVYPMLKVSLEIGEYEKLPLAEFALQFFMSALERENRCTVEFSASAFLSEEEEKYILSKIQILSDYRLSIHQEECETCKGYHPDNPIHTELCYHELLERKQSVANDVVQ